VRPANGAERAALVLMALGPEHGAPIWKELDDEEVEAVTAALVRLGEVEDTFVNAALDLFAGTLEGGAITGNLRTAEKLLLGVLPEERARPVLEKIQRPGGPNVWERLAGLNDQILSDYLVGEYPQTVAVILNRLPPQQAARVLSRLPRDFALTCLSRMTGAAAVEPDILAAIEQALGLDLVAEAAGAPKPEPASRIADIFNAIDRRAGAELLESWRATDAGTADRVRALMFTFEDFPKLGASAGMVLMRVIDREVLAVALKGTSQPVRNFFLSQMSSRAARMFEDQMSSRGPIPRREAEEAQFRIVQIAKELIASGEIAMPRDGEQEEMVE
jgi:flagellar motor switch protein FliG